MPLHHGRTDGHACLPIVSAQAPSPRPRSHNKYATQPHLEYEGGAFRLLVTATCATVVSTRSSHCCLSSLEQRECPSIPELKVLATLQRQLRLCLALGALQTQHDLLGRLGLLVEYRLRLSTVSGLLAVIATLSLREDGCL